MDMLKTSLTSLLEDLEELAESDGMIRQMDESEMIQDCKTIFAKVDAFLKEKGCSGAADDWIGAFRKAKNLKTTIAQTTEIVGRDWKGFVDWFEANYPQQM